jgi:hypothetical protein
VPHGSPPTWQLPSLIAMMFGLGVLRPGYLHARRERREPSLLAADTRLPDR